jgi:thioredoxin reductase
MFDVAIIGGGPAGLSAALTLGRARRTVLLLDSDDGRNARAAAVHGFLTRDGISPAELRALARKELAQYPTVELRETAATGVRGAEGEFVVTADQEETARRVLLATGVRDDLPDLEGLAELWGRGVFHCPYCHGYEVRGEPIVVLAVEPEDVSMVAKLACYSDDIAVCTNGTVDLDAERSALLDRLGVRVRREPIVRLEATQDRLRSVVLADGEPVRASALFVHGSTRQASDLPAELGCRLLDDGSIEVDEMQRTSVPGVYAAGDLARRPSMPLPGSMVSIAVAAGAVAAVGVDQDLLTADVARRQPGPREGSAPARR